MGLPEYGRSSVEWTTGSGASFAGGWYKWRKPPGCTMVMITCLGAGAGGGGGLTGATTTARGGGSGGGSGARTILMIPARYVPDELEVFVGTGGAGGNASSPGSVGSRSYVCTRQTSTTPVVADTVCMSGAADAAAGLAGTSTAAAGGAAGTIADLRQMQAGAMGLFVSAAGHAGSAGGTGATTGGAGSALGWGDGINFVPVTGGTGGGGTGSADGTFAGGAAGGAGGVPAIPGGAAGTNPGNAGVVFRPPSAPCWASQGGTGGGANGAGTGGKGGDGATGSGGGGGGGGITGGVGGRGGDGLVSIETWLPDRKARMSPTETRPKTAPDMPHPDTEERQSLNAVRVVASKLEEAITETKRRDGITAAKVDGLITDVRDVRIAIIAHTAALTGTDLNVDELRRKISVLSDDVAAVGTQARHAAEHALAAMQTATQLNARQDETIAILKGIDARLSHRVSIAEVRVEEAHTGLRAALTRLPQSAKYGMVGALAGALWGLGKYALDLYLAIKGIK